MTWSDEELVSRSIGGDADSFNQLVLRWERPIYALAYRTIGREEDARWLLAIAIGLGFAAVWLVERLARARYGNQSSVP